MTGELPTQGDLLRQFEERMARKREQEEAAEREHEREYRKLYGGPLGQGPEGDAA